MEEKLKEWGFAEFKQETFYRDLDRGIFVCYKGGKFFLEFWEGEMLTISKEIFISSEEDLQKLIKILVKYEYKANL